MREESEKRTVVTSLRWPEKLKQETKQKAEAQGTNLNNYIVDILAHVDKKLTPEIVVYAQNVVNEACSIIGKYPTEQTEKLQKWVDELWSLL